jgi:hypothetical protein
MNSKVQTEMPFFMELRQAEFLNESMINKINSYRTAVIYCWQHRRKGKGMAERLDQALCASVIGAYPSHFSRCVNEKSLSPMDLSPDLLPAFEAYTGNRAVTQYLARITATTCLEEIQAMRSAA